MQLKKLFKPSIRVKKLKSFYISLLLLFILFSIAYVHNNNIAYIVMFFLFSILCVGMYFGRKNIIEAEVVIENKRIFANQRVILPVVVKRGESIEVNREFIFKRGINRVKIEVFSLYPLGVAKFIKEIEVEVLVYPELKGESLKSGIRGEEVDFEDLKKYEGESLKYIYWPSVAKGELKSKRFSGEGKEEKLIFDYDKLIGDKEKRVSQIALWSKEAFDRGIEFEILLGKEKILSKEGFNEVFKKLALY